MGQKKKAGGKKPETWQSKMSKMKIWQLVLALVLVIGGVVLFVGAVSGWFGKAKAMLDAEYYCEGGCDGEMMELTGEEYEELIAGEKSFIVFVDQGGCKTADKLRSFMKQYSEEKGVRAYRIMFEKARETSMHDKVKYYPSMVVVSKGRILGFLRADEDEDSDKYNDYEAFYKWMDNLVVENSGS